MDTKKINLFVYDTKANFEESKKFLGVEGSTIKKLICIENITELDTYFNNTSFADNEYVFMVIHVFATNKISGIKEYLTSGISDKYPNLGRMFISDGDENLIKHLMVDARFELAPVYKYHEVYTKLKNDEFKVYTKKQIIDFSNVPTLEKDPIALEKYPQIDYAIITALYEDEFEELKNVFNFPDDKRIITKSKIFYRGYLITNPSIEVVAAIPNSTGMVDSAIIATLMLEFFKPKYLLMSGVCGGSENYTFGDIIIAKQIYTFQKGKLSDIRLKNEFGEYTKIDVFDIDKKIIDYNHLYDNEGNQISISIEKFEIELDTIIPINSAIEDALNPKLEDIKTQINFSIKNSTFILDKKIKIVIEPIACSTMVINKEGYFEDTIKSINRKTAAVEMESYGVARACQFANEGSTIPLIFKSVMDNTHNKSDSVNGINYKKFAAYTSAQFMKYLFEKDII